MANELKLYYSSGTSTTNEFSGEPKKSIGGIITATQIPNTFRNLFGNISLKMLTDGVEDYRCIYLKNTSSSDDISNLRFYVDTPIVAAVTDPADLAPAPTLGDEYIVPANAEGAWFKAQEGNATVNIYEGKLATYNGSGWDFSFAPFAEYEFGFVAPIDIELNEETLTESYVGQTENVFQSPSGVSFVSANGQANEVTVGTGDLLATKQVAMWIKRKTKAFPILSDDLVIDEGGIVEDESIVIKLSYDTP